MPHFSPESPQSETFPDNAMPHSVKTSNGNGVENGHSETRLSNNITKDVPKEQTQPSASHYTQSKPNIWVSQRCIDQARPLKLIYVGGGISGITGAIEFLKKVPTLEIVIYEKNSELGGTWFENRYPGCACDVPAHAYQLSYESSPRWKSFFASAPEILEYWKQVAAKYDVRKLMRFEQKVVGARWSETAGKWFVQLCDLKTGNTYEDSADVLMSGEGILNEWKWPDISGIRSFKGQLLHSANWSEDADLKDKSVAVIGSGSSGIQIVPAILPHVKHMNHYVRGRSWIAGFFGDEDLRNRLEKEGGNFDYSEEEKKLWETDRDAYLKYRRGIEHYINGKYGVVMSGSKELADARVSTEDAMMQRLKGRPELFDELRPDFSPYCKRMSPGPGYLEALGSPKVDTITCGISKIDENGIITNDGVHHPVDVIICATGFQTSYGTRNFPVYGKGGVNLRERQAAHPDTYLGLCLDGFPNFFQSMGPNSLPGLGSLLLVIEKIQVYVGQVLARMAYDNIARVEPKKKAVQAFTNFCDEFLQRTVFAEECNSWYKSSDPGATREEQKRGRVTAMWPGSSLHCVRALSSVRWEDFEISYYDDNEFGWFGNGWTMGEKYPSDDLESLTWYLNDTNIFKPANVIE